MFANSTTRATRAVVFLVLAWSVVCFGALQAAEDDAMGRLARRILDDTGVQGGLIVHVDCGDGRLTAALRVSDAYLVHGLDTDQKNVDAARAHIRSTGLYGKVSVALLRADRLPYVDNMVNLLISKDLGEVSLDEVRRVLVPEGVAHVRVDGQWQKIVKPRPDEIDDWTHFLHDASNNAVASDSVVGPPRQFQWIGGPRYARSHDHLSTLSAMVSTGGRIFYIIDEGSTAIAAAEPKWTLIARDAFNGVILWKRPIPSWEGHLRGFRSGPTELQRRLITVGDRVYVTLGYGQPVSVLDAATGKTMRVYEETKNALEIIWHDGKLLVVVGDRVPDNVDGEAKPVEPAKIWHWWPIYEEKPPKKQLVVLEADSGKVLWKKNDAETVELMPTTLAAAGKRTFFQNHEGIVALDLDSGDVLWRAERPISRRRPTWSAPTLVVVDDIVLCGDRAVGDSEANRETRWMVDSLGGLSPRGQMIAFSVSSGKRLWESDCRESYNSPPDMLVADGLVWSGNLVQKTEPGITVARDLKTGEVARTRPADQEFFKIIMPHHRCYRNKATEKYLVLGRDGVELIDLATGKGLGHHWTRGSCQYGVMPCNGLIYVPPHSCACHVESKLGNFNVLAPASTAPLAPSDEPRLVRGPAYGKIEDGTAIDVGDWPTLRHDAARSGRASSGVSDDLRRAWTAELPEAYHDSRLSSPVVAGGKLFVASVDTHSVHALDATNGTLLWSFTAGGRVDSPPTIHRGTAIFGSADGCIYCVRVSDGQLSWRFRAAAHDRCIVAHGQVESVWPVHGSVLVTGNVVQAVAGRTPYLDGGITLYRLDATSGRLLSQTPVEGNALPDVLSSDGTSVYLRHRRFDLEGVEQTQPVVHLYSPAGFLDDTWWHRTYWMVGTFMGSNWGGWPNSGMRAPSGRILAVDESTVYGFGRFNQYHRNGSHVGLGKMQYLLYASDRVTDDGKARRRGTNQGGPKVASRWTETLPVLARGMALCEKTLFVAGPPDLFVVAPEEFKHPYHITSIKALREQEAALAGRRGGKLLAVSTEDGRTVAQYSLDAPPVFDGLIAAANRLFLSTTDGKIVCYGEE